MQVSRDALAELRQVITDRFSESELQTLCFDLGVEYDMLRGQGKTDKARELVSYHERRQSLDKLIWACRNSRGDISFDFISSILDADKNVLPLVSSVKELFETCGYQVALASGSDKTIYDLSAKRTQGFERRPVYIKCAIDKGIPEDITLIRPFRQLQPYSSVFYVSSKPFDHEILSECIALGIECRTYDQLVDQMINFEAYIQSALNDIDFSKLRREYEEPYIETANGRTLAWSFIDDWIANPTSNWLTVLGDYGVGKSALLQMLLLKLADKFQQDPEHNPIPLFIPLQNFVKSFTFRNLILALFEEIGLKGVYYDAFENWVKRGKIILLLDSFDEMAQKLNRYEIHNNLRELMSGITGTSKAILTSRPTYFESNAERLQLFSDLGVVPEEDVHIYKKFSEYDQVLRDSIRGSTECQLADLTEEQRKRFFQRVLRDNPTALQQIEKIVDRVAGLGDLSTRPAIARLLITAIPALRDRDLDSLPSELNETSLFKLIVNALLQRDENLFSEFLSNSERHSFLKELAYTVSRRGQDYYIDNQTIRSIVERLFAYKISSHETPEIIAEQYFRTCRRAAGLTVEKTALGFAKDESDLDARIGFSHNALREYVYAEYIRDNLFKEQAVTIFATATLSDGTLTFLRHMLDFPDTHTQLVSRLNSFDKMRDFCFQIAWRLLPNEEREAITTIVGDPPNFSLLDLSSLDLSNRDLTDANFTDSLVGGVNFRDSMLDGAIFRSAILEQVAFDNASLEETDFTLADVRSIVVYDNRQKQVVIRHDNDARQWLFTVGSDVGTIDKINTLSRSSKYRIAHRILQKMARYNFIRSHNEQGLLRGLGREDLIGRQFLEALHRHEYLEFVRKAARGGRGADVIKATSKRRHDLQLLFEGSCPDDLKDFFDDL